MDTQGLLFLSICVSKYYQNYITNQSLLIIQVSKKEKWGFNGLYLENDENNQEIKITE
jgi:hypothetical protein